MKDYLPSRTYDLAMPIRLVAYVLGFTFLPLLSSIWITSQDPASEAFYALTNCGEIFSQSNFRFALFNTVVITVAALSIEVIAGLMLALSITRITWVKGFSRTAFLVPIGVPTLVSGVVMSYVFASNGYLNEFLYHWD